MSIGTWILAARPKTLTAAAVPIGVAAALVAAEGGHLRLDLTVCALLSALLIQIGTNFFNDAIDFKKGADTSERLGPKRVTQSGWVTPRTVLMAGGVAFALAALLGVPLLLSGGLPILVVGLVSLFCGYAYTGGPFPLAYRGLGDLFVLIFFGWVAVGGVYYLNTGTYSLGAFVLGSQIGLLATVLIAINNLRDVETDRKVGKRTLAVLLGTSLARVEIGLLVLLPFLIGSYWWWDGRKAAFLLPLLSIPMGIALISKVSKTAPSSTYNSFLGKAAGLHFLFGILLGLGLLVS